MRSSASQRGRTIIDARILEIPKFFRHCASGETNPNPTLSWLSTAGPGRNLYQGTLKSKAISAPRLISIPRLSVSASRKWHHKLAIQITTVMNDNTTPVHLRMRRAREGRCIDSLYREKDEHRLIVGATRHRLKTGATHHRPLAGATSPPAAARRSDFTSCLRDSCGTMQLMAHGSRLELTA